MFLKILSKDLIPRVNSSGKAIVYLGSGYELGVLQ
jgi:hypothetical protein